MMKFKKKKIKPSKPVRKPTKKQLKTIQADVEAFEAAQKKYNKAEQKVRDAFSIICADRLKIPLGTKFKRAVSWDDRKVLVVTGFSYEGWGGNIAWKLKNSVAKTFEELKEKDVWVCYKTVDCLGRPNGATREIRSDTFKARCEIVAP